MGKNNRLNWNKTKNIMEEKLQKALVDIALKVCEAKKSPFYDRYIITSLTELLRHFKDNGILKEALVSGMKNVNVPDSLLGMFNKFTKEDVKFPKPTDEEIERMADRFITTVFE